MAAARHAEGWRVRALVRDPTGGKARALAAPGIELAEGDLADRASLWATMACAHSSSACRRTLDNAQPTA